MAARKNLLNGNENGGVELGESPVPGMRLQCICHGHRGWIGRIAWSPCGQLIASPSFDKTVRIWDAETGKSVAVLRGHNRTVTSVAWSPDGKMLASAGENIRIWRSEDYQQEWAVEQSQPSKYLGWSAGGSHIVSASDRDIVFWDISTQQAVRSFDGATWTGGVAWCPRTTDAVLAAIGQDIYIWKDWKCSSPVRLEGHRANVVSLAWSPDGQIAASGSGDSTVRIWDINEARQIASLEGHSGWVCELAFSADGLLLASKASDNTVRIVKCSDWAPVAILDEPGHAQISGLAFHPRTPLLATSNFDDDSVYVWELDCERLLDTPAENVIRYTSAKVVLLGESNIGKSCLATRLAEDRYPEDDEQGTTHGMRLWSMDAERLHPSVKPPAGQRRDIVLWDFGGQNEYRLVHQLFLHDTTLALVLIEPTRGQIALDEARDWSRRLETRFGGHAVAKLLVGAKQDNPSRLVNREAINSLCSECGFHGYVETSARTGRNINALRKAIATALDWDNLAKNSRPELFQRIRDEIEIRRTNGEVTIALDDLTEAIRDAGAKGIATSKVKAVSEQLAAQGVLALTRLSTGQDTLVIQVPVIERYAASLVIAARDNPRGVPAFEERLLGSEQFSFPGLTADNRLDTDRERIVLECIVELMIEHGVCFRREGVLIFPTLFPESQTKTAERLPHSVSLFYDFTGAVDSIYASLVACLAVSNAFGHGRLWPGRYELDEPGSGVCGVQYIKYLGGLGHIDLFFAEETELERRRLFTCFVEDHLRQQGVEVREHEAIKCRGCGREIAEDVVHANIAMGKRDVVCQWCRVNTVISEGVSKIRQRDPQSDDKIYALRKEIKKRTIVDIAKSKQAVAGANRRTSNRNLPISILHLSDLHFTNSVSPAAKAEWLLQDIRGEQGFRTDNVEYLVISGDMTEKGSPGGFEKAREFVSCLIEELELSAERCILVPGNHDVQDLEEAYGWYSSEERARKVEPDESQWHREGNVIFVPHADKYTQRLKMFSDALFHKVIQKPYPLDPCHQGIAYLFPDTRLQFLALNSSWQIDQFHRKRSGLHADAVASGIRQAQRQVREAIDRGEMKEEQGVLRLCVWHHSVQHPEMMRNTDLVEILQNARVRICLHGDVHEMNRNVFRFWRDGGMHIVGAGSFSSPPDARPESIPRLYNLLEISRDLSSVRIHTRRQLTPNGPWTGWNEWPRQDNSEGGVPYYDIELS